MKRQILKLESGSVSLIFVMIMAGFVSILMGTQFDLARKRYTGIQKDFDEYALSAATKSSFHIMESALQRRLWELPPNPSTCLRANSVTLNYAVSSTINVVVTAEFDSVAKIFFLEATGTSGAKSITYVKSLKIFDASDYLLYSKGSTPIRLTRSMNRSGTASMIAGPRKIYSESDILFSTSTYPNNFSSSWGSESSFSNSLQRYGLVIQAERMNLLGNIEYTHNGSRTDDMTGAAGNMISSARSPSRDLRGRGSDSGAVITSNYNTASNIINAIENGGAGPAISSFSSNVYPFALFCSSQRPMLAFAGSDSGCFDNDNFFAVLAHHSADGNTTVDNLVCLVDKNGGPGSCSSSERFPNGFNAWRRSAGLENILYTKEDAPRIIDLEKLSWDNMDALKEDAEMCGHYIPTHTSAYQDCDVADKNFINRYISSAGAENCERFSTLNMNTLTSSFSNFNPAAYSNANQNRWLRRVVYSEVPLEISQTSPNGLWPNLTSVQARRNMPIWFVSPTVFRFKTYQADLTSPINSNSGTQRRLFFNMPSSSSNTTRPLKLVFVTPENIDIVSPQYVAMPKNKFALQYPLVGGAIRPRRDVYKDWERHENDGFRYGAREVNIKNIVLISNNQSANFVLRGLWAGMQQSVTGIFGELCMLSEEGGAPLALEPLTTTTTTTSTAFEINVPTAGTYVINYESSASPPIFLEAGVYTSTSTPGVYSFSGGGPNVDIGVGPGTPPDSTYVTSNSTTAIPIHGDSDVPVFPYAAANVAEALASNSEIPPRTSSYYKTPGANARVNRSAYVFQRQKDSGRVETSEIKFEGLRILNGFTNATTGGRRNLASPERARGVRTLLYPPQIDLSQRRMSWNMNWLIQNTSNAQCSPGGILNRDGTPYPDLYIITNEGNHTFSQKPVALDFTDAGNFSSIELVRNRAIE